MVRVKICGLMAVEHAVAAARAGADYVGVVFAASRRQVTPQRAREIAEAVKPVNPRPDVVGVFRYSPAAEVNRLARECRLDAVQLAGDESIEYVRQMERPVIKVVHVTPQSTPAVILAQVERWYAAMKGDSRFHCLLDTEINGARGGTGLTFDRAIAREVAEHYPVIVAGGLNPENVADLVRDVRPWGVDVASGVEIDGKKDTTKIEAFIRAVWNAE